MTPVKPMLVCINGVNQDLLWRSKKTCDNCGETVPSYIVTYDSAPNDKFVLALLPPAMLHPTLNLFLPILLTIHHCLGGEGQVARFTYVNKHFDLHCRINLPYNNFYSSSQCDPQSFQLINLILNSCFLYPGRSLQKFFTSSEEMSQWNVCRDQV